MRDYVLQILDIYIDDIDIETYDVEYLRKHIGYLPQKPIILSGEEVVKDGQRKEILKKFRWNI